MSERSQLIDKLRENRDSRAAYIRGKINVLVSAQLHALRLNQGWTQSQFADRADMKQSRVSAMEQPGAVNFNLETLVRSAATFGVGLLVKFVPFSEMLEWENDFDQSTFKPIPISHDVAFVRPSLYPTPSGSMVANKFCLSQFVIGTPQGASQRVFPAYEPNDQLYTTELKEGVVHE